MIEINTSKHTIKILDLDSQVVDLYYGDYFVRELDEFESDFVCSAYLQGRMDVEEGG